MNYSKTRRIFAAAVVSIVGLFLAGCGPDNEDTAATQDVSSTDAVTTASIVNTADDFIAATSSDGTWIIAITEDIDVDEEIVVSGEFTRNEEVYRKIALYAQDENRNITDRYVLSAPHLTVRSPNTRIQSGTFRGDVLVQAEGFHLVDAEVDGAIRFETSAMQESFQMDENSTVTGDMTVVE